MPAPLEKAMPWRITEFYDKYLHHGSQLWTVKISSFCSLKSMTYEFMNLMNENALLWNRKDSNLFLFESFNVLILISCGRLLLTYSIFLVLYKHLIFPFTLSVHVAYSEEEVIIWELSYLLDREKYIFIMTLRIKNHLSLLALSESYLSRTTWLLFW